MIRRETTTQRVEREIRTVLHHLDVYDRMRVVGLGVDHVSGTVYMHDFPLVLEPIEGRTDD